MKKCSFTSCLYCTIIVAESQCLRRTTQVMNITAYEYYPPDKVVLVEAVRYYQRGNGRY